MRTQKLVFLETEIFYSVKTVFSPQLKVVISIADY